MPVFSFYNKNALEDGFRLIEEHRPMLAHLINEANTLIESGPKYHVSVRSRYKKKWPWSKNEFDGLDIELLWGDTETCSEMQILNFNVDSFESCIMGFIHGAGMYAPPSVAWDKFITRLNEVDDMESKNFLGSIDRYKKIFLNANQ